jgi:hypothetical protein
LQAWRWKTVLIPIVQPAVIRQAAIGLIGETDDEIVIGVSQLSIWLEQADPVTAIAEQQTGLTAIKDVAFARLERDRGKTVWVGTNIDLIIQTVTAEIDVDDTVVKEFDIFISIVDHAVIVPVMAGAWHEFVDPDQGRRRQRRWLGSRGPYC